MNSSKLAVIETGGKQYLVQPGQVLKVEKLEAKTGEPVAFDKVLLVIDGEEVKIGKPYLEGVTVSGTLKREGRAAKITVFKYKRKTRSRKKRGHRQSFSEIQIGEIK